MKTFIKLEKPPTHSHFTRADTLTVHLKGKVHILVVVAAQPLFYSVFHPFSSLFIFSVVMWCDSDNMSS